MKILSIQVGLPREIEWEGKRITTGIFKESVSGLVHLGRLNLRGDGQADLKVHGGEHKAVYSYASEYYPKWRSELSLPNLAYGSFGENLTLEGMDESQVYVGDRFRVGTAELEVAQPRRPCFKLAAKFNDPGIIEKFLESGRLGVYYRVEKEGAVQAGDEVVKVFEHPGKVKVLELFSLILNKDFDREKALSLLSMKNLCPKIRQKLQARIG